MGKDNRVQAGKIAWLGVMASLGVLCGYIEYLIPVSAAFPGIKLGICNIVILTVLYLSGWKEAAAVSIVRILLIGFMFGSLSSILYSLGGTVCSLSVMAILKRTNFFRVVGVSAAGGVFHEVGQILIAALIVKGFPLLWYLPILMIAGLICGTVIGFLSGAILLRIPKNV
ncbi:MAG: Gx transporter family protein [Lachnospiraceae bacterium]|nr:Gx transporter family protein [Lachnospiraceae bacterium]